MMKFCLRAIYICITLYLSCLSVVASDLSTLEAFTADYDVNYGDLNLGKGVYTLRHVHDNIYNFSFVSNMRFLVFSDKRRVDVDFTYLNGQVLPRRYTHKRSGTGTNYIDLVTYDQVNNKIHSEHKGEVYEQAYDNLVRDGLSAQLQLMLDLKRGIKKPSYIILEANRVKKRAFEFIKTETITVSGVEYQCVLYEYIQRKKNKRTQMWFSIDHNYQPVQMVHLSKDKKKFNAELTNFKIDSPKTLVTTMDVSQSDEKKIGE